MRRHQTRRRRREPRRAPPPTPVVMGGRTVCHGCTRTSCTKKRPTTMLTTTAQILDQLEAEEERQRTERAMLRAEECLEDEELTQPSPDAVKRAKRKASHEKATATRLERKRKLDDYDAMSKEACMLRFHLKVMHELAHVFVERLGGDVNAFDAAFDAEALRGEEEFF